MPFISAFPASRRARIGAATITGLLMLGLSAGTAVAHEGPKPGSRCAMAGLVEFDHGHTQLCLLTGASAKPRWSKELPIGKAALTVSDGWVKAAPSGMTAAFGTIENPTGKPIRIIGASSTFAPVMQLHEVIDKDGVMVMQQKPGGFLVPAGGSLELKAGGNHIMFVKLRKPIRAGAMIPVILITADGGLLRVTLMAKVFAGGNETYDPSASPMAGM